MNEKGNLVISRREEGEVVIGNPQEPQGVVKVISIEGDRIRLGLDFPEEIEVYRAEVANGMIPERHKFPEGSPQGNGTRSYDVPECYII